MINIQDVMLNDMTHLAKLCIAVGRSVGLAQKGHGFMESNGVSLQQGINQLLYLKEFIRRQIQTCLLHLKTVLEKRSNE